MEIPTGVDEVTLYDWMGNSKTVPSPAGNLTLTLGKDPIYVTGVSPRLWGSQAEQPVQIVSQHLKVLDDAPVEITGTISIRSPKPAKRVLFMEPDPALGIPAQQQAIEVAGEKPVPFTFKLQIPSDQPSGTFPARLRLLEDGKVIGTTGLQIELVPPLKVVQAHPAGPDSVWLTLSNDLSQAQAVSLEVQILEPLHDKAEIRPDLPMIDLPEGKVPFERLAQGHTTINLTLPATGTEQALVSFPQASLNALEGYRLQVTLTADSCRPEEKDLPINFFVARRQNQAFAIDGNLEDWQSVPAIHVGKKALFRAKKSWSGADDLAADLRLAWSSEGLYLAVDVTDDSYCQLDTDTMIWRGDSIQLAVNVGDDPTTMVPRNTEMTFALTTNGQEAYRHISFDPPTVPMGPMDLPSTNLSITKREQGLIYEMLIPWSSLGLQNAPEADQTISLAMTINDRDSKNQRDPSALGIFGGIAPAKDPSLFGTLLLAATAD